MLKSFNGRCAVEDNGRPLFIADAFYRLAKELRECEEKYVGKRFKFYDEGTIVAVVGSEPGLITHMVLKYDKHDEDTFVLMRFGHELFHVLEATND